MVGFLGMTTFGSSSPDGSLRAAASITGTRYWAGRRRQVMTRLTRQSTMPATYIEPPSARTQYMGRMRTTVSMKSGYMSRPVLSKARHIKPCVTPAA